MNWAPRRLAEAPQPDQYRIDEGGVERESVCDSSWVVLEDGYELLAVRSSAQTRGDHTVGYAAVKLEDTSHVPPSSSNAHTVDWLYQFNDF